MKVVLFCGGAGMRIRDYDDTIPKPMVPIGARPILWHIMKYYAHYGHKDFILCLGYKAQVIKEYFLNYNECLSNDFVLANGGKLQLLNSDIHDWTITFVDTGLHSNIGMRLAAVKNYLQGEDTFLANYSDGVSNVPLPVLIDYFREKKSVVTCLGVPPAQSFHLLSSNPNGYVENISPIADANLWMNGGFYVMSREIFDYIQPGEELVLNPFRRLIEQKRLSVYNYRGFWSCMDTFKDKQTLDEMAERGAPPWQIWK